MILVRPPRQRGFATALSIPHRAAINILSGRKAMPPRNRESIAHHRSPFPRQISISTPENRLRAPL